MKEDTPDTVEERTTLLNVAGAVPQIVPDDLTDDLKIHLGEFEGPLDLLLHLIRQEQVSIYDIPIARITDEYLRYLRVMQEMDIAVAGDFLVMAATLIELKTKMLLPRDPLAPPDEEEDPPRRRVELHGPLLRDRHQLRSGHPRRRRRLQVHDDRADVGRRRDRRRAARARGAAEAVPDVARLR